jgi:hypothetical protein
MDGFQYTQIIIMEELISTTIRGVEGDVFIGIAFKIIAPR